MSVNIRDINQLRDVFTRAAETAAADPEFAEQLRDVLAESGVFGVFGVAEALDVVDLLDAGGEDALRARLHQLTLSQLRQIIAVRGYDPEKESARWRSPNKLIELIVTKARDQLEEELARQAPAGAAWML